MNKREQILLTSITTVITLLFFTVATFFTLEHTLAFLTPVLLATIIIKYRVKDGIIPAIIMLIGGTLLAVWLKPAFWYHGLIFMIGAIVVGFLHGGLSKTRLTHLQELSIVVLFDITFGFVAALIFYLLKDAHYSLEYEYASMLESMRFIKNMEPITARNFTFLFNYSFPANVILFGIVEATLTHIFIHLVVKYVYKLTDHHSFSGLKYKFKPILAVLYFVFLFISLITIPLMRSELSMGMLIFLVFVINITLVATLLFVHQGVVIVTYILNRRIKVNISLFVYVVGLIAFPLFALVGAFDSLFKWSDNIFLLLKPPHNDYF